jgi:uncharacterized protein YjbI with pentapeptide repeats
LVQQESEPQQRGRCQYRSKIDPTYKCNEPTEPTRDFCIFHDPDPTKDKEKFKSRLKAQVDNRGRNQYSFVGYHFPAQWGEWAHLLSQSTFQDDTYFWGAEFRGDTNFGGAQFSQGANFGGAKFHGDVYFKETLFEGYANFGGVRFRTSADFRGAHFSKRAIFWEAKFRGGANFGKVQFGGDAYFRTAEFRRPVSFRSAKFHSLGDKETAFRKARRSYEEDGDRAEADYYFRREMIAKRKQKSKWQQWPCRSLEWLVDLTCAYGTSYWRVLISALAIILGAAVMVAFAGNLELLKFGTELQSLHPVQRLLHAGYFSFLTFTTLSYGEIQPIGELAKTVASVEAFIGTFMMALFVVVFARKYMR